MGNRWPDQVARVKCLIVLYDTGIRGLYESGVSSTRQLVSVLRLSEVSIVSLLASSVARRLSQQKTRRRALLSSSDTFMRVESGVLRQLIVHMLRWL